MAQEQGKDDSVFDFAYIDRIRLGSLLAQLSDDGVVATTKRTSSLTGTNQGSFKLSAKVVSANGGISDAATEALERSFDASMLLPINALTVLQESGLINRGLKKEKGEVVTLGTLVQLHGFIAIRDIEMVRRLWTPMTGLLISAERPEKRKAKREELDFAWKIIKELPPTVQFSMLSSDGYYSWGVLNPDDPTFSTHNLGLKHGSTLQGHWHLVGIMDAYPELELSTDLFSDGGFLAMMGPMLDEFRKIMGRPNGYFGITPLAIFRPIGGPNVVEEASEAEGADEGT